MVRAVLLAALAGCGFTVEAAAPDATSDSPIDTPDMELPPDEVVVPRVTNGLIGFWTFNDANDTSYALDTSGTAQPVHLLVDRSVPAPTFSGGMIDATNTGRLISDVGTHLSSDIISSGEVTLEVWARPAVASQGSLLEPWFLAGIAGEVSLRNVALMQANDLWLAQVRTTTPDGKPSLVSTTKASTTQMAHIVVVANASKRAIAINGSIEAQGAGGTLATWDPAYRMTVVDEAQHARQFRGTVALVALYNRALTNEEIQQNFTAGPNN